MQIQNHLELQKIRNYCYLHFYFNTVFQRQISYTEITNLLQLAINVRRIPTNNTPSSHTNREVH